VGLLQDLWASAAEEGCLQACLMITMLETLEVLWRLIRALPADLMSWVYYLHECLMAR
jgi:hypothetical protein